jgi:hypothetical protein
MARSYILVGEHTVWLDRTHKVLQLEGKYPQFKASTEEYLSHKRAIESSNSILITWYFNLWVKNFNVIDLVTSFVSIQSTPLPESAL